MLPVLMWCHAKLTNQWWLATSLLSSRNWWLLYAPLLIEHGASFDTSGAFCEGNHFTLWEFPIFRSAIKVLKICASACMGLLSLVEASTSAVLDCRNMLGACILVLMAHWRARALYFCSVARLLDNAGDPLNPPIPWPQYYISFRSQGSLGCCIGGRS